DGDLILQMLKDRQVWRSAISQQFILSRLSQRYAMSGDTNGYIILARLMQQAPDKAGVRLLVGGLKEGLRGSDLVGLPPELQQALRPFQSEFFGGPLALALRQGEKGAIVKALQLIADEQADLNHRLTYIGIFGEIH